MGTVCAKNEAGAVATDTPIKKPTAKQLESGGPTSQPPQKETRLVSAGKHFATVVGNAEDKAALDALAKETADEYCQNNPEWKYTGKWQDEKGGAEPVSFFEVEKVDPATANNAQSTGPQVNKALAAVTEKVQ